MSFQGYKFSLFSLLSLKQKWIKGEGARRSGSALVPELRGLRPNPGKGSGLRLHVHHLYYWVAPADMGFLLMAVIVRFGEGESLMEEFWSPAIGSQELSPRPVEKGSGQDCAHCLFLTVRESFAPLCDRAIFVLCPLPHYKRCQPLLEERGHMKTRSVIIIKLFGPY